MSARTYRGPFGDTLRWIAGGPETDGEYALLERTAPAGTSSAPHTHKRREAFYVLSGELTFTIDGIVHRTSAGTFLAAADGVSHGWRVEGDGEARVLLLFSPAVEEQFFVDSDSLVRSSDAGRIDAAELAALMDRHGWR